MNLEGDAAAGHDIQARFAHGVPPLSAVLRSSPEDFQVIEQLGYAADGEGEHVLLTIRKRGLTTAQALERLARHAGVRPNQLGCAGMKDRHAIAEQAVSVQLAGQSEPDWGTLPGDDLTILAHARHRRKIKRGALQGNRFVIILRALQGDREAAERVLQRIHEQGVPNYFAAQRFGRGGGNVEQARAMFAGRRVRRQQRAILLSAARSWIFNQVLDSRVADGSWQQGMDGELYCLDGSRSWFGPEPQSQALDARLARADIHPSGPLWGEGGSPAGGVCAMRENHIAGQYPDLVAGLVAARMTHARRALRLMPRDLTWDWQDQHLQLRFALPAGCYATAVIRELATTSEPARRPRT